MATLRDVWLLYPVVKDSFWDMVGELPRGASFRFERTDEEDNHKCQTLFDNHPEEMGVLVSPCSLLRMRIAKGETLWSEMRFESKT